MLNFIAKSKHVAGIYWQATEIGEVRINLRDAMVFMDLNAELAIDPAAIMQKLKTYLLEDWSGKAILTMPYQFFSFAVEAGFQLKPTANNVIYFSLENVATAITELLNQPGRKHDRAKKMLQIKQQFDQGEWRFISKKQDFEKLYGKMFEFLVENTTFVSEQKKLWGLYSEKAMELRVQNEIVWPYAIIDKDNNIIATTFINEQTTELGYVSDVVVAKQYRDQGVFEYHTSLIYQDILQNHPQIKAANLIAGGDGEKEHGQYINIDLFKGINIEKIQRERPGEPIVYENKAVFVAFGKPGPLHLHAANRNRNDQVGGASLDATGKFNSVVWTLEELQQLDMQEQQQFATDKQAAKIITGTGLGLHSSTTTDSVQNSNNQVASAPPVSQLK